MRIVVFGATGMLGKYVHDYAQFYGHTMLTPVTRVQNITKAEAQQLDPDVVINCAGITMQKTKNPYEHIMSNAVGPQVIARAFDFCHVVHISTDCVFRGNIMGIRRKTTDTPDAIDLYGRTKVLGEVIADHVTNVRTSFIAHKHGLLGWLFDSQYQHIYGYRNALWSGSTVYEVADAIVTIAKQGHKNNIEHLATTVPISKYELIHYLTAKFELQFEAITPVSEPIQNRALKPTIMLPQMGDARW